MRARVRGLSRSVVSSALLLAVGVAPLRAQLLPVEPTAEQLQRQMDSIRAAEADAVIRNCQIRNAIDPPNIRVRCWEAAKLAAPTNVDAINGHNGALQALQAEEKSAQQKAVTEQTRDSINTFLARAETELARGSVDQADSYVTDVLAKDPTNARALRLRERVSKARVGQANWEKLKVVGAVVLALALGIGVLAKKLFAKKGAKADGAAPAAGGAPASGAPVPPGRRVAVKIVDGVGRGRMYTIDGDLFRIGAAESAKKEEKNDLVLSDSAGLVSRFHCALIRRDKKWILLDSSLNGTLVNDKPVPRGEPHAMRDGDEITIAGVSRLTFLTL